jgi:hypothetical protein
MTPRTLHRCRITFIGFGASILLIGFAVLLTEIPPARYVGIGAWLLGALILHDAVIAAVVVSVGVILRRPSLRIPFAVTLIIQSTLAVGGIVSLLVVPAVVKKAIGSANPSLLPSDYLGNLLMVWAVLLSLAAAASAWVLVRSRSARRASSAR